jgi:hypothetical protein
MIINKFRWCFIVALSFSLAALLVSQWTRIENVSANSNRVFEMRVYHTFPGRFPARPAKFRDNNIAILKKHGITSIGYWIPQDAPGSENTLIFIVAHDSRETADKNWKEFSQDPEWLGFAKASMADGPIVEKVDTTFMLPADFSAIK